jgi:site-specific recombinase XerC
VQRVLSQCERETADGKRNYAVLLMLARLGLRACEIVALNLDDIDWDNGLLTIRCKGGRWAQLPMPTDVGELSQPMFILGAQALSAGVSLFDTGLPFVVSRIPLRFPRLSDGH